MRGRGLLGFLAMALLALTLLGVLMRRPQARHLADHVYASPELDALVLRADANTPAQDVARLLASDDPGVRDVGGLVALDQVRSRGRPPNDAGVLPPLLAALADARARLEQDDLDGFEAGLERAARAEPLRTCAARLAAAERLLRARGLAAEPERLFPGLEQGTATAFLAARSVLACGAVLAEQRRVAGDDAGARRVLARVDAALDRLEPGSPAVALLCARLRLDLAQTAALLGEEPAARARAIAVAEATGERGQELQRQALRAALGAGRERAAERAGDGEGLAALMGGGEPPPVDALLGAALALPQQELARVLEEAALASSARLRSWVADVLAGRARVEPDEARVAGVRARLALGVALETSATPADVLGVLEGDDPQRPPYAAGLAARGLAARGRLADLPDESADAGDVLCAARALLGDPAARARMLRLGQVEEDGPFQVADLAFALARLPGGRERLVALRDALASGDDAERVAVLVALEVR